MNTLLLRVTGLCAFVPNSTIPPDRMRVILVDASVAHGGHDMPHVPRLIFPYNSWQPVTGGRVPDERFSDPGGTVIGVCDISGQEVSIDIARNHSLTVEGWGTRIGECPNPDGSDQFVFPWVGPMQDINVPTGMADPTAGELKDHFLDPNNVPSEVIARASLTEGHLRSFSFANDDMGRRVKFEFDGSSGASGLKQAMAEEVELSFQFNSTNYIDFNFLGDIHSATSSFGPKLRLNASGGVVYAWIANMPDADIKSRFYVGYPPPNPHPTGNRDPDYHFPHFYDLIKGGTKDRIPTPVDRCMGLQGPSVDNPKCPPLQLNPNQNA